MALFQAFNTLNLQQVRTFSVPPVTLCGPGAASSCGQQAQARGLKHLFVMADSFLYQAGMTTGPTRSLAVRGIAMTLRLCPAGEPCITGMCATMAQLHESGCDGVIASDGGSVLDVVKAVALLVTNPDSTLAGMSKTSVLQPCLPSIAIPATVGAGPRTTNVMVTINTMSGRKQVLAHTSLVPDVAIFDTALTEGVPSYVTAMTGTDALTRVAEAYSALNVIPSTDSLAIDIIAMIGKSLPKTVDYGHDPAAHESMLLALCMAGMAFSSARLGLCHAMAHQPGAVLCIPYGPTSAMLLPTVMEFNRMVCRDRFGQIGRALRTRKSDDRDVVNAVSEPIAEARIGKRLGNVGAISAHYGVRARAALEGICPHSSPRTTSLERVAGLYAAAQQVLGATLATSYSAYGIAHAERMRRSRRVRQWRGTVAGCDVCRALSDLRDCTCGVDRAFMPHPPIDNN